ncbi:hypothetical protein ACLB2K_052428 [Fragaria x ananassa]
MGDEVRRWMTGRGSGGLAEAGLGFSISSIIDFKEQKEFGLDPTVISRWLVLGGSVYDRCSWLGIVLTRGLGAGGSRRGWDVKETEDSLLLRMDMPGLNKEDVKISVEQGTLTVKGEGKDPEDEEDGGRRFSTRLDLPAKIYELNSIKAEMKNGVLKLVVPKVKEEEKNIVFEVKIE